MKNWRNLPFAIWRELTLLDIERRLLTLCSYSHDICRLYDLCLGFFDRRSWARHQLVERSV
jgi:hypothetical protein